MSGPLSWLLAGAGVAVLCFTFWDSLVTTLVVARASGPLTARITSAGARILSKRPNRERGWPRTFIGPAFLVATVFTWVGLLWAGWTMLFVSGDAAVVDATSHRPAGLVDVVYYTGFTAFTIGIGDYVAASPGWRLTTAFAGFTGLFLITLSITYLLSVVSAAVNARALAAHVHSLGDDSTDIVVRAWDGTGFSSSFVQHLVDLTAEVALVAEQHLAYPVLRLFHAQTPTTANALAIAHLADAMHYLVAGVGEEGAPPRHVAATVLRSVDRYVDAHLSVPGRIRPGKDLGLPRLELLRDAGIPVVAADIFAARLEETRERRAQLDSAVRTSGWVWM